MNNTIAIAGTGYVGLSVAILLAQHNKVTAVDIIPEKVDMINARKSPIQDKLKSFWPLRSLIWLQHWMGKKHIIMLTTSSLLLLPTMTARRTSLILLLLRLLLTRSCR